MKMQTPINTLSNKTILEAMDAGRIKIDHFDGDMLDVTSYRLRPYSIRYHRFDDDGVQLSDEVVRIGGERALPIKPGEYTVISPKERITLDHGFIGTFIPTSWCIEKNLLLTVGRMDSGYPGDLVFGVYNAGRSSIALDLAIPLVKISFDFLGQDNMPSYGDKAPGSYIRQIESLRARATELDQAEADLIAQRQRIKDELARLTKKAK